MSLLEQLKEFKTVSALAQSLRAQNPGFTNVPELAMLYSHSIMDAINNQHDDHAYRLYRLALTA
ncbi:MAG: hypothetical protein Q8S75_14680 [Nitrospirota bacterium]|nr:hypothetical protein [Nitrospirota bacterium]